MRFQSHLPQPTPPASGHTTVRPPEMTPHTPTHDPAADRARSRLARGPWDRAERRATVGGTTAREDHPLAAVSVASAILFARFGLQHPLVPSTQECPLPSIGRRRARHTIRPTDAVSHRPAFLTEHPSRHTECPVKHPRQPTIPPRHHTVCPPPTNTHPCRSVAAGTRCWSTPRTSHRTPPSSPHRPDYPSRTVPRDHRRRGPATHRPSPKLYVSLSR